MIVDRRVLEDVVLNRVENLVVLIGIMVACQRIIMVVLTPLKLIEGPRKRAEVVVILRA